MGCLEKVGAGIGGVLGGGGVAEVVVTVVGWMTVEWRWWSSGSWVSSLTVSSLTSWEVGLFGLGNGRGVWISLKFLEHGGARIPIRRVEVNWHGAKSKQVGRAGGRAKRLRRNSHQNDQWRDQVR